MKLQIWWIIGRDFGQNHSFTQKVDNEFDAGMLLTALAWFDLELGDEIVFSNAGGLNEWEDEEWITYYDKEGTEFDDIMAENQETDPTYYVPVTEKDFRLVSETLARYAKYVFEVGND